MFVFKTFPNICLYSKHSSTYVYNSKYPNNIPNIHNIPTASVHLPSPQPILNHIIDLPSKSHSLINTFHNLFIHSNHLYKLIMLTSSPKSSTSQDQNLPTTFPTHLLSHPTIHIPNEIIPPFPKPSEFTNLISLTLDKIYFSINVPETLETLKVSFLDIHYDGNISNVSSVISNLSDLTNLKHLTLKNSCNIVNLSNHPYLETLYFYNHDHHNRYNETIVIADKPHLNIKELYQEFRHFNINAEFVPNLTLLHAQDCDGNINNLTKLTHLKLARYFGDELDMNEFKNLVFLDIGDEYLRLDDIELPNLITMRVDTVKKINKSLYPKLKECRVRAGYYVEDVMEINHDGLEKLVILWEGAIGLKNMRNLEVLKVESYDFDFANSDECKFEKLKYLKLRSMDGEDRVIRIDIDNMPNLEKLATRDVVDIVGKGDGLLELRVTEVVGLKLNYDELAVRFKNLKKVRIGWDEIQNLEDMKSEEESEKENDESDEDKEESDGDGMKED